MRALLFHNQEGKDSRDFLVEAEAVGLPLEVVPFMEARSAYLFRGCPCVWIGGETPQEEVWSKAIDVTLQDVQDALSRVRELRISGPSSCAPGSRTYTVSAFNFEGMSASLPEGTTITVGGLVVNVTDDDPEVEIEFEAAGVYTLKAVGKEAVPFSLEVVVGG